MAPQPPADLLAAASARRLSQQSIAAQVRLLVRRLWRRIDPSAVIPSWDRLVGAAVLQAVTAGQLAASAGAQEYVAEAVAAQGAVAAPAGALAAEALAGIASDGRPLDTLLRQSVLGVLDRLSIGVRPEEALTAGLTQLERIAVTQVQDAGRVATGVAVVNDRTVKGYIRYLTPPSCSRCIILAGRWYAHNQGFKRHPNCDCVHMPAAEVIEPQDPLEIFQAMTDEERRKAGWHGQDVHAIEDGADIFRVTNARRSLTSTTIAGRKVKVTRVGTTRRLPVRLMPESIYDIAGADREEAIRLLRVHQFIL